MPISDPTLFMIKIGARPKGRLIEQHDVFFGVGEKIGDFVDAINQHWPEVKNAWHLDAYRAVTVVGNYQIRWQHDDLDNEAQLSAAPKPESETELKLFFINLGGYLPEEFEEYHHKLLVVATSQAEAIKQAKRSEFYKKFSFQDKATPFNAASHIDDKQQVDVDDIYNVNDLLNKGRLVITQSQNPLVDDKAFIGYLSLKKLRTLSQNGQL